MEQEISEFLNKLENKQDLPATLASLQLWLVQVAGGNVSGKSTKHRKASHANNAKLDLFCELQDSFAYNLCGRLVRVMLDESEPAVLGATLHTIQGVCLMHRASRLVFNSDLHLGKLLALCQGSVQIEAISTLCAVMVHQVEIIRRFERLGGLKVVTDIFKHKNTPFKVKRAILEFLFFYLVPETKLPRDNRKTTADKQVMLGKYLSNVDGLVRELEVNKPFGVMELDW